MDISFNFKITKKMKKIDLEKLDLPELPGVYFFRDGDKNEANNNLGNILYIGKATNLRDRTKSYFAKDISETRGLKIVNMVLAAEHVTYQVTSSVLEALLLENQLIKKNQPVFNTKEKDNKTYTCVVITKEDYPRVLTMRVRDYEKRFVASKKATSGNIEKVDKVYGPFTNGMQIKDAIKIIRKIFPFRDRCEIGMSKPCFNAQIRLCPGCCVGLIKKEDYKKNIKHIKDLFEGNMSKIKRDVKSDMEDYAKKENFEMAAKMRNTLWALDHIRDVSLIKDEEIVDFKGKDFRIEAYDVAHMSGTARVGVMTVVTGGKKDIAEYRKFKLVENVNDDYAGIVELMKRRFKHTEWPTPDLVVFDGGEGQKNIGEKVLASMNILVATCSVVKDDKHKAREVLGLESTNIAKTKIEIERLKKSIILANSEAHRFAIKYHKEKRADNFIKK